MLVRAAALLRRLVRADAAGAAAGLAAHGALALASAGLAVGGAVAGFFSAGILALPAFVGCGALFGWAAALLHRTMEPRAGSGDWLGIHRRGGAAAGVGLAAAMLLGGIEPWHWSSPELRYAVLGLLLSLGFAWHSAAAWRQIREDGQPILRPGRRALVLVGLAYAVPALPIWPAHPHRWAPAWPADLLRRGAQAVARRGEDRAADAAALRDWRTTEGRTLVEGERAALRPRGGLRLSVTAPDG